MKIASYLGSHMVLQRNMEIVISGTDEKYQKISVNFMEKQYTTTTDENGQWQVVLEPAEAGGPYTMEIKGSESISFEDILMGDVYLLGGQSNMELRIMDTLDTVDSTTLKDQDDRIRYLRVEPKYNYKEADSEILSDGWKCVNEETVGILSAIGYYFAKEIKAHTNVPIGLVNTAVGGSSIEAWMNPETLAKYEDYEKGIEAYNTKEKFEQVIASQVAEKEKWLEVFEKEQASVKGYVFETLDKSKNDFLNDGWDTYIFSASMKNVQVENYQGSIWLMKDIELSEEPDEEAVLRMGLMVDSDTVWVNGHKVGHGFHRYEMRWYKVPKEYLHKGTNRILIQLVVENGKGGAVPNRPYYLQVNNQKIELEGEWLWKKGTSKDTTAPAVLFPPLLPVGLFLGSLKPLAPLRFTAVLWYQGESNTGHKEDYAELFSAMKQDWEACFGMPVRFCKVQLPGYTDPLNPDGYGGWDMIREYQRRCEENGECGMVTAIDLGEAYELHPHQKKEIARRLSLWARYFIYGQNVEYSGPKLKEYTKVTDKLQLYFEHMNIEEPLELTLFEVSRDGKDFYSVDAVCQRQEVVLHLNEPSDKIKFVRYAWGDDPKGVKFYNNEGLPACSFLLEMEE